MDYHDHARYPETGDDNSGDDMHDRRPRPDKTVEILQRVRRLETRVTTALIALGFDPQAQKPSFDRRNGRLQLPSPHSSLSECTKAIPNDWCGPVQVYVGDDLVAVLDAVGNRSS